jgi:hypothetical protein
LIFAAAASNTQGAKRLFSQALLMDADDYQARLMLFLIDWIVDDKSVSIQRQEVLNTETHQVIPDK